MTEKLLTETLSLGQTNKTFEEYNNKCLCRGKFGCLDITPQISSLHIASVAEPAHWSLTISKTWKTVLLKSGSYKYSLSRNHTKISVKEYLLLLHYLSVLLMVNGISQ